MNAEETGKLTESLMSVIGTYYGRGAVNEADVLGTLENISLYFLRIAREKEERKYLG